MNSIFDIAYDLSPIFIQNKIISLYGRKIFNQRYGDTYRSWFEYYKNRDYSNIKEEKNNQITELISLSMYAKKNSPFFQKLYKDIDLNNIASLEDIDILPIVEKETFRKNINDIYTIKPNKGIASFTGGTTGKSLKTYFTKKDFQKRMAYLDAFKFRSGIKDLFNSKKATFSGRSFAKGHFQRKNSVYWRYNESYNQKLYSTFDMQTNNLPFYIEDLNKFSPEIINGFVSAIYQLAQYILDKKINLTFTPKAIFTTSETLLSSHRKTIEQAFKSRVFNQYASAEGAPFITECIEGNLHYNIDTGIIEQSGDGSILVTSFTSYGTPLIRYNIGDKVTFSRENEIICACGSSHPIIESIDGRSVDYLYSPERGKVSLSHLADVIKGIPNSIKEMQFLQDDYREIKIRIHVDNEKFNYTDEKKIIDSMRYRFGNNMKFTIEKVEKIERTVGGKLPLIKNSIDD